MYLNTLILEDRQVCTPSDRSRELGNYWASTFSHRAIDIPKAKRYLKKHAVDFCLDNIPDTSPQSISFFLKHTHNSKTGPNGIPYAAYAAAGIPAAVVL